MLTGKFMPPIIKHASPYILHNDPASLLSSVPCPTSYLLVLCGYSGVLLLVSAGLIAAQSDQPTTISLAEKILLKIGDNIKI